MISFISLCLPNVYIKKNTAKQRYYYFVFRMIKLNYDETCDFIKGELSKLANMKEFAEKHGINYKRMVYMKENRDGKRYPLIMEKTLDGLGYTSHRIELYVIRKKS